MPNTINYIENVPKIKGERDFREVFGYLSNGLDILVSHAAFNHTRERKSTYDNLAHLNTLSSITGALRGNVIQTLDISEHSLYVRSMEKLQSTPIALPPHAGEALIEEVITCLPAHIQYLRVVVAGKAQSILEDYYMNVGRKLRDTGKILESGYYGDHGCVSGISFQIR